MYLFQRRVVSQVRPRYATAEDLEYTDEVSGVHGNFLKSSLQAFRQEGGSAWKDVFSAGHGVAFIEDVPPAARVVERMVREYEEALGALPRHTG